MAGGRGRSAARPGGRTLAAAKVKGQAVTASDPQGEQTMEGMERAANARMEGARHKPERS